MAKNEQLRPQTIKTAKTVEVKTALPWTIIVILAIAGASLVAGWNLRSSMVLTNAEVRAEVLTQLAAKK